MNTAAAEVAAPQDVQTLLNDLIRERDEEVHAWLDARRMESGAPFYSSVDLRHAGFKLAPVDTNLFPAGFNNLSAAARKRASERVRARFARYPQKITKVLVIPENHTRNKYYIDNLQALSAVLTDAGCEVRVGSLTAQPGQPLVVENTTGGTLTELPLTRKGSLLATEDGFCPNIIVLNNDLTAGLPEQLRGVSQPIVPRPSLGWHRRRKSIHFDAYDRLAHEFADTFSIDPWLLTTEFHKCGRIDFAEKQGMECIAVGVEKVLHKVRVQYNRYGITAEPYVFVKADSGTYGMGIMTVRSGEELIEINKKIRNKMDTIKEGVHSTEVIIQEGVPTIDTVDNAPAEPMLYLIDAHAVGGAYRVNAERDATNNLNAPGMRFAGMCDEGESNGSCVITSGRCFGAFGLVAELASLAAPREEYGDSYVI